MTDDLTLRRSRRWERRAKRNRQELITILAELDRLADRIDGYLYKEEDHDR